MGNKIYHVDLTNAECVKLVENVKRRKIDSEIHKRIKRFVKTEGQDKIASLLRLEVFDALGRRQQVLAVETGADGRFRQVLDVWGLPAGMLLVKMTDGEKSWSAKVAKR